MIHEAEKGFKSQWGDFIAEGIVARPMTELKNRNGSRIITKIKHKDFAETVCSDDRTSASDPERGFEKK